LALRANEQLRQTYTIGQYVASARAAMAADGQDPRAGNYLAHALAQFDIASTHPWLPGTEKEADAVGQSIHQAIAQLGLEKRDQSLLDPSYAALADLAAATRHVIELRQVHVDRQHRMVLSAIVLIAATLTLAAWLAAVRLYRAVMIPLNALGAATRQLAANRLTARAPTNADEEFAALARDFNRTADELQSLYADLERRVAVKSHQLARADRLASVGYLAAGVAHEINNPLAIIAGFAERSLQRLARPVTTSDADSTGRLTAALEAIRDESFRCKQITTRLLELARPSPSTRARVSLAELAADVVRSLRELPRFADRHLTIETPRDPYITATIANDGEIRQVILNLLINALEATDPHTGRIHVKISDVVNENWIELSVADNGHGLAADTMGRIFEPFFSEKRSDRPGTGLGLSIAHAIVTDHAGTLDVRSRGAGQGATFTLRLPAAHSLEHVRA
jgi:signal transduction histidine kinase